MVKKITQNSEKNSKKNKNLKPFKKGQTGNPGGRPKLEPEVQAIRLGSKPQIIEAYGKYSNVPTEKIKSIKSENLIEEGVKKCLMKFAKTGDVSNITKLWDQVHGKPTESVDVTSKGQSVQGAVVILPTKRTD